MIPGQMTYVTTVPKGHTAKLFLLENQVVIVATPDDGMTEPLWFSWNSYKWEPITLLESIPNGKEKPN